MRNRFQRKQSRETPTQSGATICEVEIRSGSLLIADPMYLRLAELHDGAPQIAHRDYHLERGAEMRLGHLALPLVDVNESTDGFP
jgi:hypothetical protein